MDWLENNDILMLCANCHRIRHHGKQTERFQDEGVD